MTGEAFRAGMARLTAMWPDRSPSADTTAVYADALRYLDDTVWIATVRRCLRECKWFPVPAEIISRADELLTDAGCLPPSPEAAWQRVAAAIRAYYPGQSSGLDADILDIVRQVGGLHNLAISESEYERSQARKEFIALYTEHRRRIVYLTPEALSQPLPGGAVAMLPNGRSR